MRIHTAARERLPIYAAHRGYSSRAPENTIPAFEEAVKAGFGAVECDIWQVRGKTEPQFLILHDESLRRMCGADIKITELTEESAGAYPVIRGKNIGKYKGALSIPSLQDYLRILAGSRAIPIIEIKGKGVLTETGAAALVKLLDKTLCARPVILQSFDLQSLRLVKPYLRPGIERFLLVEKRDALKAERLDQYRKEGICGLSIKYTLAAALPKIKARALRTAVWTVDLRVQAAHLQKTGWVDFLISNRRLFT